MNARGILCRDAFCAQADRPHYHEPSDGQHYLGGPVLDAKWPDTGRYVPRDRGAPFMSHFHYGEQPILSHSGLLLSFKIICDRYSDEDWASLARIVAHKFIFSETIGIPRGGLAFAEALRPWCSPGYPTLVVDDVMTTGRSMERARARHPGALGVVLFARCACPAWVFPMFQMPDFWQAKGTGVG